MLTQIGLAVKVLSQSHVESTWNSSLPRAFPEKVTRSPTTHSWNSGNVSIFMRHVSTFHQELAAQSKRFTIDDAWSSLIVALINRRVAGHEKCMFHHDLELDHRPPTREAMLPEMSRSYKLLLSSLGEDPERPGLLKTPERAAKAMLFFTKGYDQSLEGESSSFTTMSLSSRNVSDSSCPDSPQVYLKS